MINSKAPTLRLTGSVSAGEQKPHPSRPAARNPTPTPKLGHCVHPRAPGRVREGRQVQVESWEGGKLVKKNCFNLGRAKLDKNPKEGSRPPYRFRRKCPKGQVALLCDQLISLH